MPNRITKGREKENGLWGKAQAKRKKEKEKNQQEKDHRKIRKGWRKAT